MLHAENSLSSTPGPGKGLVRCLPSEIAVPNGQHQARVHEWILAPEELFKSSVPSGPRLTLRLVATILSIRPNPYSVTWKLNSLTM